MAIGQCTEQWGVYQNAGGQCCLIFALLFFYLSLIYSPVFFLESSFAVYLVHLSPLKKAYADLFVFDKGRCLHFLFADQQLTGRKVQLHQLIKQIKFSLFVSKRSIRNLSFLREGSQINKTP
jgi:hypothetical protein